MKNQLELPIPTTNNVSGRAVFVNNNTGIMNFSENINRLPSLLSELILILSQEIDDDIQGNPVYDEYIIKAKISYNKVTKHKRQILSYGSYSYYVGKAYQAVDMEAPHTKSKISRFFNSIYEQIVSNYLAGVEDESCYLSIIQSNSDDIIDELIYRVKDKIKESNNSKEMSIEELEFCVPYLIYDAFIECKVLEKPE